MPFWGLWRKVRQGMEDREQVGKSCEMVREELSDELAVEVNPKGDARVRLAEFWRKSLPEKACANALGHEHA